MRLNITGDHTGQSILSSAQIGLPKTPKLGLHWVYVFIRLALAALFIVFGITKLLAPQQFAVIIQSYGLIPEAIVLPVAFGLASLEVVAGLGLVFEVRGSLTAITGLLILFMLILGYGLWLGLDVDCGCFADSDPEANAYHSLRPAMYRDAGLLVGIAFLYFWRRRQSLSTLPLTRIYKRYFKGDKAR